MGENLFRAELHLMKDYVPGKPVEEVQAQYNITHVDKLASNENPLGPSPKALEYIKKELQNINIYPDSNSYKLKLALTQEYGLSHENFVVGNGAEQIIQLIADTLINPGDEAIMADVTFDICNIHVTHMGGIPVLVPLKNYKQDIEGFLSRINKKTKLIYICNPNNPIGNILAEDEIHCLIESVPEDIVIVLDEAYFHYAIRNPKYGDSVARYKIRPNLITLRTFSKAAGIAGVRVGYAITSKEIAQQMCKTKGTFNVNRLAQAAALGALEDKEHIQKTVDLNYKVLAMMEKAFEDMGMEYIKSSSNFIFVNIGMDSKTAYVGLMKKGIIVKPGTIWGMNTWLRVSTGTVEQAERLTRVLRELTTK